MRLPLLRGAAEIHHSSLPLGSPSRQQILAGKQTPGKQRSRPAGKTNGSPPAWKT